MNLLDVHIKRYGHFTDASFNFEDEGVQIVLGPNEAGKTTLLEFVRELLFGFAERNPYDFGTGRIEGSATLRLASGELVELRRHKGRKNTVSVKIDGQDTDHDADDFNALLGGATATLFRSVFAFGLKELAAADEGLRHENIRSALFSGGLSMVANPKRLLDVLKSEADKLFKKAGQIPVVNALCNDLGSLTKQVKEKSVRAECYEQRRDALRQEREQAGSLGAEWTRLRQEHSLTKKLLLALPLWLELGGLQRERGGLTVPDGFPLDGKHLFETARLEIDRLARDRAVLGDEVQSDETELAKVRLDPRLVEHKAAVEHAQRLILSVTEARRDLPLRRSEVERTRSQVQNELAELVPRWSPHDLLEFRMDAATRATLAALVQERRRLDEDDTHLLARAKSCQDGLRHVAADLSALGEPVETPALVALMEVEAEYHGQVKELTRLGAEQGKIVRTIDSLVPRLNPPLRAANADAHALPVPPRETVAAFKREFAENRQRLHTLQQSSAEEEADLAGLQKELAALHGNGAAVPTLEALSELRGRREAGWELVRRVYVSGEEAGADSAAWLAGCRQPLPDAYEEAVRAADSHADALFDKSSAVVKQEQIETTRHLVESKRQALANHEAAAAALRERWHELWRPCGFVPLEPDAMESWLAQQRALGELVQQRQQLAEEAQALGERSAAYEARLRDALSDGSGDMPTLLAAARAHLEAARKKEQDRVSLEKTKRRLVEQRNAEEQDRRRHQELLQEWDARWRGMLERLRLPVHWPPELAQNVLARLSTARVKMDTVADQAGRAASMALRLDEFDPEVRKLCMAVAPDLVDQLPEVAAATLQERLTLALAAQERRASLERGLADKRKKLRELDRQLADARAHRQHLLERAGADSDDEFLGVAERAQRILVLDGDIAAKQRELELIRENEEPASFTERLQEADLELLQERLRELDSCLEKARHDKTAADEHVGSCRAALAELEKGSGEAAALQEQAAAKRAQLAASVDRYVPLVFAQHLLRRAMERFEQQSQPEMLRDVTRIFQTMTEGRYVRVERPLADDQPLLVYRDTDEPLEPSQLSTGAREQLYLAIRLAYVLHYCSRAEPLPIVMDDVLANFDDDRARRTLQALGDVAERVRVILFTCHPHLVALARDVFPRLRPVIIRAGEELLNYRV